MTTAIPYTGKGDLALTIAEEQLLGIYEPNDIPQAEEAALFEGALSGLDAFLTGCTSLLVIINDATRPTPTPAMLTSLMPRLEKAGITDEMITILVATGAHRAVKESELPQLLGVWTERLKGRLVSHVSTNEERLVEIGKTRNGTPIILNKLLFSCDRIIATGSVEPHYFAGFTGGRKAFLPGIAGYRTIEANHKLAISPSACALALEGNPVHEDMMDALPHIKAPIYSLMTVLNKEQEVVAATGGDLIASFEEAVEVATGVFCVEIPQRGDVVVSVAKFPMDINLYQAQKAIDNGALAVKDGGTLILVASCREGIGGEEFARLLSSSSSPDDALSTIQGTYKLGYHKAAKMAAVSKRITVMALTDLDGATIRSLFLEPVDELNEAVSEALARARAHGVDEPKVIILPDGCVTVPRERAATR